MKNGDGNGCGTSHISISIPEVPNNFHTEIPYNEVEAHLI